MSVVYFVRHAKPDLSIHNDLLRPLNEDGIEASYRIATYFADKGITKMFSSPYKRSIDTIDTFAKQSGLGIKIVPDFRERKICDVWIGDFEGFVKKQWEDFEYKLDNGEALCEVQSRNIAALHYILEMCASDIIMIGTHGTALSTILNYYDNTFGYEKFKAIKGIMPWIVRMEFEGTDCKVVEHIFDV